MLAISSDQSNYDIEGDDAGFAGHAVSHEQGFSNEFLGEPMMLEDLNFDDLFVDVDDKDALPYLEADPGEVDLAEFTFDGDENETSWRADKAAAGGLTNEKVEERIEKSDYNCNDLIQGDKDVTSSRLLKDDGNVIFSKGDSLSPEAAKVSKKSSTDKAYTKGSNGKRKLKVDWTPELHRRFVQAVEQLGIDKAVPSRILEIMGINCLTRHNIASHLQKYRSHRKHLLAREAEAAGWNHRRQTYYATSGSGGSNPKSDITNNPWFAPTIPHPPPPTQIQHPCRPLHVWGHPTADLWPKHFVAGCPAPTPLLPWLPPPPHPTPWLPHYPRRFPHPAAPCISPPPHPLYRADRAITFQPNNKKLSSQIQLLDTLPSKESVDAAIGDALAKPWLPLPLGLKPPSLESVMGELQKQGISKIPPPSS